MAGPLPEHQRSRAHRRPADGGGPATTRPSSVIVEPGKSWSRTVRRAGDGLTARDAHPCGVTQRRKPVVTVELSIRVATFSLDFERSGTDEQFPAHCPVWVAVEL